ncbi:MAG TPA: hypothetical protein VEN81_17195 [Planctomycetota bacterium]|nr:hypothetical protein [Planctomycetota bacterium]
MPSVTRTIEDVSVALVGNFNPAMFQPSVLSANNLVRPDEASKAEIGIIHSEACAYTIGWLFVEVTRERFQGIATDIAHSEPLRDLLLSLFRTISPSQIAQMGLNHRAHFQFEDPKQLDGIFGRLTPTAKLPGLLKNPRATRVTYTSDHESKLPSEFRSALNVTIEPSLRTIPGVYIALNRHYEGPQLEKEEALPDYSKEFLGIVESNWSEYLKQSRELVEKLAGM